MHTSNLTQKRTSFRRKILRSIIPIASIIFIALGTLIYLYLKDNFEKEGKNTLKLLTQDYAHQLETEFITYTSLEKQFNTVLSNFEKVNVNDRRDFFVNLTRNIMSENKKILALFVDFDKNAFDGKDEHFRQLGIFPRLGRFSFVWSRVNEKLSIVKEYSDGGLFNEHFYSLAREHKKTVWIEPYYADYIVPVFPKTKRNNENSAEVFMTTIASPVFNKNNKVIGVTGIDISLNNYVELVNNIKPFETGYAVLFSANGSYLVHPNQELFGKNILDNPKFSKEIAADIYEKILKKNEFTADIVNEKNERILYHSIPINIGIEGSELMLSLCVPHSEIIKEANRVLMKVLMFFILTLVIIIIVIVRITNKISFPIETLAFESQKIISGDLSFNFESNRNDEIDDLADALNTVSQTIHELVSEISHVTFAATMGKFDARCDTSKFKGKYRLMLEEVNETIAIFKEPLNLLTEVVSVLEYPSLRYVSTSGRVEEMLGYTVAEYTGMSLKDILHSDFVELTTKKIEETIERYYAGEIDVPVAIFENKKIHKNGSTVWVEVAMKILFDDNNKPYRIVSINRKIDERKKYEATLKESESILRALTENTKDIIWIIDAHTMTYTYQSKSAESILGYTYEETILGKRSFIDAMPTEDVHRLLVLLHEKAEQFRRGEISKIEAVFEATIFHKDGHSIDVEISAAANLDENNEPVEFYGITRVVTERKKMEMKLRESERILKSVTENTNDLIWILDAKTMTYTYQSAAAMFVHGYDPKEILLDKRSFFNSFAPETLELIDNIISEKIEQLKRGETTELRAVFEAPLLHRNGNWVWVEVSAGANVDEENNPIEFYGVTRVIEDRKRMELALKESESRYTLITNTIRDMIVVIDFATLQYTYMAGACEELTGFTSEEYLGKTVKDIVSPESFQVVMNTIDEKLKDYYAGKVEYPEATFEVQQYHKNGSLVWIEVSAKMTLDERGEPNSVIGIVRAIDDRKKMELALMESERILKSVTENTNDLIWIVDAKTMQYIYQSAAAEFVHGYTVEEVMEGKRAFFNSFPPECIREIRSMVVEKVEKFKRGETTELRAVFEVPLLRKDGSLVWCEISAGADVDAEGNPTEFYGVTRIIEDRKKMELALKESEARHLLITETIKDIIMVLDFTTLQYTYMAGAVKELTGFTPEEYLGMTIKDILTEESFDSVKNIIDINLKKYYAGEVNMPHATFEVQQYHKNGSIIWIEVSAKMTLDAKGEPNEIIGIIRVIDDRKRMELAIKESEQKYRLMSENTLDLVAIINITKEKLTFASEACYRILGYTQEEILDLTLDEIMPPDSYEKTQEIIRTDVSRLLQGKYDNVSSGIVYEAQHYRKDGSLIWVEISAKFILPDDYYLMTNSKQANNEQANNENIDFTSLLENLEVIAVTRVIDDRKKMELTLKESEARYTLIANTIKDIILMIDISTLRYLYVAGACEELTGFTPEECLKVTVKDLVTPESFKLITEVIETNLKKYYAGEIDVPHATFEFQQYHKNGSIIWTECSAKMTVKPDGTPDKIIAINRVIEDRKKMELVLKENERRYRLMADNTNDMFWTLDVATQKFTYMSGACCEISGYTATEYLNMELKDILPPHFLQLALHIIESEVDKELINIFRDEYTKKSDTGAVFEVQQYNKNGSLIWVEMSIKFLPTSNTSSNAEIVGTTRLIDARKKIELKLKDSESKHRLFAENTNDMIWMLDAYDFKLNYVGGAFYEIMGYTREELLSMDIKDIFISDSLNLLQQEANTAIEEYLSNSVKNIDRIIELQQYHKNGHLIWTELSFKVVSKDTVSDDNTNTVNDRSTVMLVGSTRLINERKTIYAKLQASEQKHKAITENAKDPIWTIDLKTMKYTYISPSCYDVFGWTVEEHLNMTAKDILPPSSLALVKKLIAVGIEKYNADKTYTPGATLEMQKYHKNGYLLWVEVSARILTDETGELSSILGVSRNIDARKANEAKILEQQEELEHQKIDLEHQKNELEKANAQKDKFFSIIAHDLRNPFAALLNTAEVLFHYSTELNTDNIIKYVGVIHKSATHIHELLENLLGWAHSSMGAVKYNPIINDISETVYTTVKLLEAQATTKKISIEVETKSNDLMAVCDIRMIETVIRNLISNAIKFSYMNSTIKVVISNYTEQPDYLLISVKDSGTGIPTDKIDKLFRIEEKTVSTKGTKNESGSGLGLILCKEFIDKHNCKIWLKSTENKGTTFFFTLPKAI